MDLIVMDEDLFDSSEGMSLGRECVDDGVGEGGHAGRIGEDSGAAHLSRGKFQALVESAEIIGEIADPFGFEDESAVAGKGAEVKGVLLGWIGRSPPEPE